MGSVLAALYILSVLLIFLGLGLFLKRHVLNKHPLPGPARGEVTGTGSNRASPSRPSR